MSGQNKVKNIAQEANVRQTEKQIKPDLRGSPCL